MEYKTDLLIYGKSNRKHVDEISKALENENVNINFGNADENGLNENTYFIVQSTEATIYNRNIILKDILQNELRIVQTVNNFFAEKNIETISECIEKFFIKDNVRILYKILAQPGNINKTVDKMQNDLKNLIKTFKQNCIVTITIDNNNMLDIVYM